MWVSRKEFDVTIENIRDRFRELYDIFTDKYVLEALKDSNESQFQETFEQTKSLQQQHDDLVQRHNDLQCRVELLERMAQDNNVLKAYRKKCAMENEVEFLKYTWEL